LEQLPPARSYSSFSNRLIAMNPVRFFILAAVALFLLGACGSSRKPVIEKNILPPDEFKVHPALLGEPVPERDPSRVPEAEDAPSAESAPSPLETTEDSVRIEGARP
jgi:hypothetical protein